MNVPLASLKTGTIFVHEGKDWEKGSTGWGMPYEGHKDCRPEIVGKPSVACYPKLGGQFQENHYRFIAEDAIVSVH